MPFFRFGGLSFAPDSSDPTKMKSTVWFNNKGRHAMPSFYNALSNTLLRATLSEGGVPDPESYGMCNHSSDQVHVHVYVSYHSNYWHVRHQKKNI